MCRLTGRSDDSRGQHDDRSTAKDTGPRSFREHFYNQGEIIDRARNDDVMFYGIGMRSRRSVPRTPGLGAGGLRDALLADPGGGYAEIRFGQDLGAARAKELPRAEGRQVSARPSSEFDRNQNGP